MVPEARLNLAGYRLRTREPLEARALLEPLQPTSPLHYILRGVVAVSLYNDNGDVNKILLVLEHWISESFKDDLLLERERRALAAKGNMLAPRFAKCLMTTFKIHYSKHHSVILRMQLMNQL